MSDWKKIYNKDEIPPEVELLINGMLDDNYRVEIVNKYIGSWLGRQELLNHYNVKDKDGESIVLTKKEWGKMAIVPTLNISIRSHWSKTHKQKKQWTWIIRHCMDKANIKRASEDMSYLLLLTSYRKRMMDQDNLYGSHKWMIDALRGAGFIYDDDLGHCQMVVRQEKATKKTGQEIKSLIERFRLFRL
jgi:Holliday junction resolvase RusA-like endonuclease